jgi:hypothetical protein
MQYPYIRILFIEGLVETEKPGAFPGTDPAAVRRSETRANMWTFVYLVCAPRP